jgi:hypothetical protein
MRALREHPRVTIVKAIGAVLLVAVGIAIGTFIDGGDLGRVDALEVRMARHSLSAQSAELQDARARARRAAMAAARAEGS